jgi:SET domain-containing protein
MSENEFKTRANNLTDIEEIDELCLDWLRDAAKEQSPKEREMIQSALDVVRRGVE